jgi:hypothetical protein
MRKAIAAAGIAVLAALALTATSSASFAQADSTGGTIGKTDKSISGGEETPAQRPTTPSPKLAPTSSSLPSTIHINEHKATYGEFSATLRRTNSNIYEGVWNQGTITRMTVTIGQESMTMERVDLSGGIFSCHGHYTGTRVLGTLKASGADSVTCGLNAATSTWDASW